MADHPKAYLYRRVVQAKLYIDDNYSNNIDLNQIADQACFSKFHFIRIFKQLYNYTPHQYLIKLRVDKATQLLKGDESVVAICVAVGFDSVTTFTSLFKKIMAETPAQYQARIRSRRLEISKVPLRFIPNCFAEKSGFKNSNSQ